MTEEVFNKRTEEIESYLDSFNIFSSGSIYCFVDELDPEMSYMDIFYLIKDNSGTNNVVKWSEYISTR